MAAPKKTARPPRDTVVNVRMTTAQKERFTKAAVKADMALSDYLRRAAQEKADREGS